MYTSRSMQASGTHSSRAQWLRCSGCVCSGRNLIWLDMRAIGSCPAARFEFVRLTRHDMTCACANRLPTCFPAALYKMFPVGRSQHMTHPAHHSGSPSLRPRPISTQSPLPPHLVLLLLSLPPQQTLRHLPPPHHPSLAAQQPSHSALESPSWADQVWMHTPWAGTDQRQAAGWVWGWVWALERLTCRRP